MSVFTVVWIIVDANRVVLYVSLYIWSWLNCCFSLAVSYVSGGGCNVVEVYVEIGGC